VIEAENQPDFPILNFIHSNSLKVWFKLKNKRFGVWGGNFNSTNPK
jgi:hypothetical protein